jgi:DNA-binding SARP family transcriptional activator/Tfp pilus assembly protein PilF
VAVTMASDTEFLLLGPLLIRTGNGPVPVQAAKQRALLAALLLRANSVVPVDDLAEALWGADVPSEARVGVQNYVMRLRKVLGPARSRIVTRPGGYLIQVEPGELDLDRFEDHVRIARTAARSGNWPEAASQASAALALWRGEPLADVGSDLLSARAVPRLAELHLQALETRLDADLRLGRHGDVISELRTIVAANPLRERLHGLLMLALYRDGRQAEALAAYQHARQLLIHELGTEPGPELEHLHQQVLTADAALVQPANETTAGRPAAAASAPRELPGDVAVFTGRAAELAELDRLLLGPSGGAGCDRPTTAVISAVSGTAGVGKTALAVHWAHRAAGQFPDGQLYVNLRGYDPDKAVLPDEALAGFLRSLGVPGQEVPQDETERAARYRSLLAGKQMLIVLDNAATVEQVRPLLPGHPGCRAVVTSRDSLAGLVARDGARRLDLDLLPPADAVALLRGLIGEMADAERAVATELAEQCARLPLALRIAAELAVSRPATSLADLVAELRNEQRKLDLLQADGDPRTAIRAVFSWSYDRLDHDTARAFRLSGLHPGADFDDYALAALTDSTVEQARKELGALIRAHLIQPAAPGRFGMHDLLGAYARELAYTRDGEPHGRAMARLLDYYLQAAAAAMNALYPAESLRRPDMPPSGTPIPSLADRGTAWAWLDAHLSCLVAITAHAAHHDWPWHATRLSITLYRYLLDSGHAPQALTLHADAREAARLCGDRAAEAEALMGIAAAQIAWARYREAAHHYQQAVALFREAGDRTGQARALDNLGHSQFIQGACELAADCHSQALALFRQTGDCVGEARALSNLGRVDERQGRVEQALGRHLEALAIFRDFGERHSESFALARLGRIYLRQSHYEQAARCFSDSLALFHKAGSKASEAEILTLLGLVRLRQGRYDQATDHQQQALSLSREVGDRSVEAIALNGLGETLLATGRPADATATFVAALELTTHDHAYQAARAHQGLGRAYHVTGDARRALEHWQAALALYAELGAPEADEVRAQLAALDSDNRGDA